MRIAIKGKDGSLPWERQATRSLTNIFGIISEFLQWVCILVDYIQTQQTKRSTYTLALTFKKAECLFPHYSTGLSFWSGTGPALPCYLLAALQSVFPRESQFGSLKSRFCVILLVSPVCILCCQLMWGIIGHGICFNMVTCYVFLITGEAEIIQLCCFLQASHQTTEYVSDGTTKGSTK